MELLSVIALTYEQGTYVVKVKCPMQFEAFPFDRHFCDIKVRRFV